MYVIRICGPLSVGDDVVLRFYPDIKPLLDEIRGRGWHYDFSNVVGEAEVAIDLDKVNFRLHYYPPRIDEFEEKGRYEISAEVGEEPPVVLNVKRIDKFKVSISTEHTWGCVEIDPLTREINCFLNK